MPIFNAHFTFLNYLVDLSLNIVSPSNNSSNDDPFSDILSIQNMISDDSLPFEHLDLTGRFGHHPQIEIPEYFQTEVEKYYKKSLFSAPIALTEDSDLYFPPPSTSYTDLNLWASLDVLFSVLTVSNIIDLLTALLLDGQVLIIGSSMLEVTMSVFGLAYLLTPFSYSGIIMPVLPTSNDFLDLLYTPTPFLCGVPPTLKLKKMQFLESTYIVNLDKRKVSSVTFFPKYPNATNVVKKIDELIRVSTNELNLSNGDIISNEAGKSDNEIEESSSIQQRMYPQTPRPRQTVLKPIFLSKVQFSPSLPRTIRPNLSQGDALSLFNSQSRNNNDADLRRINLTEMSDTSDELIGGRLPVANKKPPLIRFENADTENSKESGTTIEHSTENAELKMLPVDRSPILISQSNSNELTTNVSEQSDTALEKGENLPENGAIDENNTNIKRDDISNSSRNVIADNISFIKKSNEIDSLEEKPSTNDNTEMENSAQKNGESALNASFKAPQFLNFAPRRQLLLNQRPGFNLPNSIESNPSEQMYNTDTLQNESNSIESKTSEEFKQKVSQHETNSAKNNNSEPYCRMIQNESNLDSCLTTDVHNDNQVKIPRFPQFPERPSMLPIQDKIVDKLSNEDIDQTKTEETSGLFPSLTSQPNLMRKHSDFTPRISASASLPSNEAFPSLFSLRDSNQLHLTQSATISAFPRFSMQSVTFDHMKRPNPYNLPFIAKDISDKKIRLSIRTINSIIEALHESLAFLKSKEDINCFFVTNSAENITIFNQELFLAANDQKERDFSSFLIESQTFQDYVESKLIEFTQEKQKETGIRRRSTFGPKSLIRKSSLNLQTKKFV